MQYFHLVLFWVFFGFLAAHLAKKHGRRQRLWFALGLFFGIFAIILLYVLPSFEQIRKKKVQTPPPFEKRSDAWMKMWYYLDDSRQQKGPIEFPDLIDVWKKKSINDTSLVWGEGMEKWKSLKECPEVLEEMEKTPSLKSSSQ